MTEAEKRLEETLARLAEIKNRQRVMSCRIGAAAALGAGGIMALIVGSHALPAPHPAGFYLVYIPVAISRALGGKRAAWTSAVPIFATWAWLASFDPGWMLAAGIGLTCVAGFKIPKSTLPRTGGPVPVPVSAAKRVDSVLDRNLVAPLLD